MTKHKKKGKKSVPNSAAVVTALRQQDLPQEVDDESRIPTVPNPSPSSLQPTVNPQKNPEKETEQLTATMSPSNGKSSTNTGTDISSSTITPVVAAVQALLEVIKNYNGNTVNGLMSELKSANANFAATRQVQTKCKLAVNSACAQFIRYATLTLSSIEAEDVSKCRAQMLSEGLKYLKRCEGSINKISRWAVTLIFDGARILVHSDSFVVLETLRSVPKNIYFSVFIVNDNDLVKKSFEDNYNIDVKTIRDAEVGTLMESMDLIMVGAEAVLKNGGIINKVGTLSLAICAREMNKPMYVLAESFKFSLMYPMSQMDLPKEIRENSSGDRIRVDYTLPKYITFLVTDRGLLTPTAVCDELIELYT